MCLLCWVELIGGGLVIIHYQPWVYTRAYPRLTTLWLGVYIIKMV